MSILVKKKKQGKFYSDVDFYTLRQFLSKSCMIKQYKNCLKILSASLEIKIY